jgi:hypothetical protein
MAQPAPPASNSPTIALGGAEGVDSTAGLGVTRAVGAGAEAADVHAAINIVTTASVTIGSLWLIADVFI